MNEGLCFHVRVVSFLSMLLHDFLQCAVQTLRAEVNRATVSQILTRGSTLSGGPSVSDWRWEAASGYGSRDTVHGTGVHVEGLHFQEDAEGDDNVEDTRARDDEDCEPVQKETYSS